jgi:hypothetical protein
MRHIAIVIGVIAMFQAAAAESRQPPPTGNPATLQSLLACRSISDSGQRLACYDKASGDFASALGKKEVVVIDKARANEARRSLFGFSVPNFGALFGGGGDDINHVEGTVAEARQNGDGGWTVKLADGSVWAQTDDTPIALEPRRGDKVVVRRGTLGSYFVKLGSQPGFKAKRVG